MTGKLERFLKTGNQRIVLGHLKRFKKLEVIALAVKHSDLAIRMFAIDKLERVGPSAAPHIAQALLSEDSDTRARAAAALGNLGSVAAPYAKDIAKLVSTSERWYVREPAAMALAKIGNPEVLPELRSAFKREKDFKIHRLLSKTIDELGERLKNSKQKK